MIKKYILLIVNCLLILLSLSGLALADSAVPILNLPMLEKLDVSLERESIKIDMRFSQEIDYTDVTMQNPTRFVIDVQGGWFLTQFKQEDYQDSLLRQVRYFQYRDGLRIVAELKYAGSWYDLTWNEETNTLTMIIQRKFTKRQTSTLADGVTYHYIRSGTNDGPVHIHALEIEINPFAEGRKILEEIGSDYPITNLSLRTTFRKGSLVGFNKISDLVEQEDAFAGINGGYFGSDGLPLGLLIQDGQLVSAPILDRTAWGIDADGRMRMDRVSFKGDIVVNFFERRPVSGINRPRYSDELILYTPPFGRTTNSNQWGLEVVVQHNRVIEINQQGNSVIPPDGFVVSAHGIAREFLENVKIGDRVQSIVSLNPDWLHEGVIQAIGGGPRLVEDGKIKITGQEEKFLPDILYGRAPRSALGITADNRLLMVTVDGRAEHSIGMTLQELADLMLSLGSIQAMNLDGGKSSTLIVRDKILNTPSVGEIGVHNGLILKLDQVSSKRVKD